jgi:hypothetical protein
MMIELLIPTAITLNWLIPLMHYQIKCTNIKMAILIKWINLIILLWHFISEYCNILNEKQVQSTSENRTVQFSNGHFCVRILNSRKKFLTSSLDRFGMNKIFFMTLINKTV